MKEYYDLSTKEEPKKQAFEVYFEGNFWEHSEQEPAGREILLNQQFTWGFETWNIPAVYYCNKGLVVDFCVSVKASRIQSFTEKWQDIAQDDVICDELQEQLKAENPLSIDVNPSLILNGEKLNPKSSCATVCLPDGIENNPATAELCNHYGCDKTLGWRFIRVAFPWATRPKPKINSLILCLEQELQPFTGSHFIAKAGAQIDFSHPINGQLHTLTVISSSPEFLADTHFNDKDYEFPHYFKQLTYTLEPDLENESFTVRDCSCGDSPRLIDQGSSSSIGKAIKSGAFGVILIPAENKHSPKRYHTACSALYFKPAEEVEWRTTFQAKTREDLQIVLI